MDTLDLSSIIFLLLAFVTVGGAIFAIHLEKVMHIVISISVALLGIVGVYLFLNASFLAIVQLFIYAGAISILMIFSIMLTNHKKESLNPMIKTPALPFIAVILLFFSIALVLLLNENLPESILVKEETSTKDIGVLLFTEYTLPTEILSILLLASIVGTVVLTRRNREERG